MRQTQNSLLKDNLQGEKINLLFNSTTADGKNGLSAQSVPFVFVRDIGAMIIDYLDRIDR